MICVSLLAACGAGKNQDEQLQQLISRHGLAEAFVMDFTPESDQRKDLGASLFFSPDLSIDGSVSCASCHHPEKGGADGISLPVGIGGVDSRHVGQARLDAAHKNDPVLSLEGLIPRNTPTVINVALYRQNLFWDGRAQYGSQTDANGKRIIEAGFGVAQYNPSNYQQNSLLQTQARMPMTSAFEMKGGLVSQKNNHEIEQSVIALLKTNPQWCEKFSKAFNQPECDQAITLENLSQALADFQASLVFTDSPFERYIRGEKNALTEQQKLGAISFLQGKAEGGIGCIACHSGKAFSSEKFFNINIPASGRGANDAGWDLGRNNVDRSAQKFSFRVPILLNVALTAPYFHNGVALTLEDAIAHHVTGGKTPRNSHVIALEGVDYNYISKAIADDFAANSAAPLQFLPAELSSAQIANLAAFLQSLTDPCLTDKVCLEKITRPIVETPRPEAGVSKAVVDVIGKMRKLDKQSIKVPVLVCKTKPAVANKKGSFVFNVVGENSGIDHKRVVGLIKKGWLIDVVNYSGVSAVDVDYDCLDDLVFDAGKNGLVFYKQTPVGNFERQSLPFGFVEDDVNPMIMDLDGDYRFDLFVGNLGRNPAYMAYDFQHKKDLGYRARPVGPVINASIADIDLDGDMDITFALWRSFNTLRQEHIWMNDGNGNLSEHGKLVDLHVDPQGRTMGGGDTEKRITPLESGAPDLTFTPNYADMDNDGDQDLLLAADFFRSQILRNDGGMFIDITDKKVVDDNNAMGAAVADFDNDGDMDWFVSSIKDQRFSWINGHRLYRNDGKGKFTNQAIGEKDEWSWGSCARDFNNDGLVDIFYVSGFGEPLKTASYEAEKQQQANEAFLRQVERFSKSTPAMLINDGKGGFVDQSKASGFGEAFDGRGIACFDYQQDGDIDIVVSPLEGAPRLYRNNLDGSRNWLAIRLIGLPGNTEALGTKVKLYSKGGVQYREVMFENNFVSRNPAQLHFGLADDKQVEKVVIDFPAPISRQVVIENPPVNQLHVLKVESLLGGVKK